MISNRKINETEEGITNLQTELETTDDEVKTNTAEVRQEE